MYTRPPRIYSDLTGLEHYIEGSDIYNSKLLYLLSQPGLATKEYVITESYRTDVIAMDFYGSLIYEDYVILQTKLPLSAFRKGLKLNLIEKSELDNILRTQIV